MDPAAGSVERPSGRRADLAIGVVLGLALGLAIVAVFVFVFSQDTIDDAELDAQPPAPVERPSGR